MKKWKEMNQNEQNLLVAVAMVICIFCGAIVTYAATYEKVVYEHKTLVESESGRLINAEIEMDKLILYFNYTDTMSKNFIIIDEFEIYEYAVCKSLIGSKVYVSYTIYITTKNGVLHDRYNVIDQIIVIDGD